MFISWSSSEGYPRPRLFLMRRFPVAGNCNILQKAGRCLGTDLRKFLLTVSFRFLYCTEDQEVQLSLTAHWQCWVHSSWGVASSYLAANCLTQLQPRIHRQRDSNIHETEKQRVTHLLSILNPFPFSIASCFLTVLPLRCLTEHFIETIISYVFSYYKCFMLLGESRCTSQQSLCRY